MTSDGLHGPFTLLIPTTLHAAPFKRSWNQRWRKTLSLMVSHSCDVFLTAMTDRRYKARVISFWTSDLKLRSKTR